MPFGDLIVLLKPYIKIGKVVPRKLASDGAWYMTEWREEKWIYKEGVYEKEHEEDCSARLEAFHQIVYDGHL